MKSDGLRLEPVCAMDEGGPRFYILGGENENAASLTMLGVYRRSDGDTGVLFLGDNGAKYFFPESSVKSLSMSPLSENKVQIVGLALSILFVPKMFFALPLLTFFAVYASIAAYGFFLTRSFVGASWVLDDDSVLSMEAEDPLAAERAWRCMSKAGLPYLVKGVRKSFLHAVSSSRRKVSNVFNEAASVVKETKSAIRSVEDGD